MEKLNNIQKQLFCAQLETVLNSGLSISEGLLIMSEDKRSSVSSIAKIIHESEIRLGSFYEAVKESEAFDEYFCSMVKIGEVNGQSDKVMKELTSYYERQEELNSTVKQAITYPFGLLVMMDVIVAVLYFKVFPVFENVMNKTGISTGALMNIARVLTLLSLIFMSVMIVLVIGCYIVLKTGKDKNISSKLLESLPVIRNVYNSVLLSRVTYAISLFVSSGYPVDNTLSFLPGIVEGTAMSKKFEKVKELVETGASIYEAFDKCEIYSGVNQSFLTVGLKAGKEEETFEKLASILQKESYEKINSLTSMAEPVFIGVLSLMVGMIIISIMLPLVTILSSIG